MMTIEIYFDIMMLIAYWLFHTVRYIAYRFSICDCNPMFNPILLTTSIQYQCKLSKNFMQTNWFRLYQTAALYSMADFVGTIFDCIFILISWTKREVQKIPSAHSTLLYKLWMNENTKSNNI